MRSPGKGISNADGDLNLQNFNQATAVASRTARAPNTNSSSRTPSLKGVSSAMPQSPRNVPLPASPAMSTLSSFSDRRLAPAGAPGLSSQRTGSQLPANKNRPASKGNSSGTTTDGPSNVQYRSEEPQYQQPDWIPDDERSWRRAFVPK
ncbi:hypothetical protein BT69DRAFT_1284722 [Atractiella rhizophila]|nr:hypothetical protein BT69DRAFT_1284722 [Atractiella rhizophila]